jgi:P pilus assembly chaperone PapD
MKILIFVLLLILNLGLTAEAQISVNDVLLEFKANERPVQNVLVKNSAPEVFYVTGSCEEIEDPSIEKSKLLPTEDILISPKQFSIDAKSDRSVRLLHRKAPDDKEHVYRVAFVPQERPFQEGLTSNVEGRVTSLKVITGMGLLVFVNPREPIVDFKWERKADKIKFTNAGNLHTRLSDGKACISENVDCEELTSKRVYGGKDFELTVNPKLTVYFTRRDGNSGDFKSLVIPPAP